MLKQFEEYAEAFDTMDMLGHHISDGKTYGVAATLLRVGHDFHSDLLRRHKDACDRWLEVAHLTSALRRIAALDYEVDGLPQLNEWAQVECFEIAQRIAREALRLPKPPE